MQELTSYFSWTPGAARRRLPRTVWKDQPMVETLELRQLPTISYGTYLQLEPPSGHTPDKLFLDGTDAKHLKGFYLTQETGEVDGKFKAKGDSKLIFHPTERGFRGNVIARDDSGALSAVVKLKSKTGSASHQAELFLIPPPPPV